MRIGVNRNEKITIYIKVVDMFGRKSREELCAELEQVNAAIAALPCQSDAFLVAQEIIETMKSEGSGTADIDAVLAAQNLPSVAEVGKVTMESIRSVWKLNRRKNKLEKQLAKL